MIARQTLALFVEAYRELNSKKLFWITMALNLLVVGIFAALGINERGVGFLHWTFDSPVLNTSLVTPEVFYKLQFVSWASNVWLAWVAVILGLVATCTLVPDLIASGAIETTLSKPIGRLRLFLTKYATGLLFVVAQVLVFTLACFVVIGVRGGAWEPRLFLAVPIVTLVFSYLFAVSVLLGMLTRSAVAALLLTALVWVLIFVINSADAMMLAQREGSILKLEDLRKREVRQVEAADKLLAKYDADGTPVNDAEGRAITDLEARRAAVSPALSRVRAEIPEQEESVQTWRTWAGYAAMVKTVLPKTGETTKLLERHLISMEDVIRLQGGEALAEYEAPDEDMPAFADRRVAARVEEALRGRTTAWVIGTSLVFEGVLVGIAALLFCRRDF
jgi:ABC-type transport system involved in multi-copper enzyme maturation permease subunit